MRIFVFFDLPTITSEDKAVYRQFRKLLISNGFVMLQESVYVKLSITPSVTETVLNVLRKHRPAKGSILALIVTEAQFAKMEFISGEAHSEVVTGSERLVVL